MLGIKVLRFILFWLLLFLLNFSYAQSPNFKQYNVEHGLPSSECYQVLQDKKGYLWIASDKGVSRYDGTKFTNYTLEDGLPENCIIRMFEDPEGRIWFGGLSGKLAYFKNNKIQNLNQSNTITKIIESGVISSFSFSDSTLWIGTYNCQKNFNISFKGQEPKLNVINKKNSSSAYLIHFNNNTFLYSWLSKRDENSNSIETIDLNYNNNGIIYKYTNFFEKPYSMNYNIRFAPFDDNFLFLSFSNQIYKLNQKDASIKLKKKIKNVVLFIFVDSRKGLWLGTHKGGIYYYPKGMIGKIEPKRYLTQNSISGITEDREGGFWISSLEKGIFYVKDFNFSHITNLSSNHVICLGANDKTLYAGLDNGKLVIKSDEKVEEKDINSNPISLNIIRKIQVQADQSLVICGVSGMLNYNNGILKWHKINEKKTYTISFTKSKNKLFYYTLIASNLIKIDNNLNKTIEQYSFLKKTYSLCIDDNDIVWIAAIDGLYSFHKSKFNYFGKVNKLLTSRINDIEIKENIIWMATKEYGVTIKKEDSIYQIKTIDGLASTICQSLFLESEKIAWVATNKGISKVTVISWDPFKTTIRNYSTLNGLLCNEVNEVIKFGDIVYVASNQGITWFNEKSVGLNKVAPPIYIENLNINKEKTKLKESYRLNYFQNNLSINYIGLAYKNNGDIEYRYKLIGLDTNWNYTKISKAEYTTLPYGNYKFEVEAKNNDGIWSSSPAYINFHIAPPFWHTWTFRIISGLIFLSSIYLFIKWRIQKVEKRANENAKLYQQTIEMEMKFLSSQMNPHFTFNAMNSIQYYLLENEPEKAQKYLVKYSKLIRKVLENNMKKHVPINEEIEMLCLYMDIESLRFEIQFDYQISISDEIKEQVIQIPPMIIQPYLENAIWHGISNNKGVKGIISLSYEWVNDKIKCTITDNGVGRKKAKEMKPDMADKESLGMLITHQRLQQLQSDSELKIKPNIIDLVDASGNGIGTQIEIYLPFIKQ